ncbi:MAG: hypothetical protein JWO58_2309 [Chitinophagaceae bacterium]|nr:hypothetical protein [Chitinophagaceae bacterium]
MNKLSIWGRPAKITLSIIFGLLGLLLSPYGIVVEINNIQVDIPWSPLFPMLIALSFGWRYGLLAALSGGACFPFLLWAINGWANVTTTLTYSCLFILLGLVNDTRYLPRLQSQPLRITLAVFTYITINLLYDHFLFQAMLHMNPVFWTADTVTHIDQNIIYGFAFKDTINVITLALAADTFLRVPFIRRSLGIPVTSDMQPNTAIFITTIFIPVLIWFAFIGLGFALLRGNNVLLYEHKSLALLVILANGFLVSRLLFHYSEKNERAIAAKNKKLQQQNRELEQFVYIASHDLQEPLQTLMSITALLKEEYSGKLDEQADTYLGFINQSSQRMRDLVKGLLDYAKIGHSGERVVIDVQQLLHELLSELSPAIKKSGAIITLQDLPTLSAYRMELKQLFQHLILNAIKFARTGVLPEIYIYAQQQPGQWLFAVQDNGIGMDTKNKDKIFIIFKRLHNRNEYDGTGIGLAHGKKIVALHNGSIWVQSKPGEGSTFYFTIPTGEKL